MNDKNGLRIIWVFRHRQSREFLLTSLDSRFETLAYMGRQNEVYVCSLADFDDEFVRSTLPESGYFRVSGHSDFNAVLADIQSLQPDVVVCEGAPGEGEWPYVKNAAPGAYLCLYYGGGPIVDLDGSAHPGLAQFDHVFVPHDAQARLLSGLGVKVTRAFGIPLNRFRPMPEVPKLWHCFYPAEFSPTKRHALLAQYVEQYAPAKPSLFTGGFGYPEIVQQVRDGNVRLNNPGPHRNNIHIGGRIPYAMMPIAYNMAEVVVCTSQEESGPLIVTEAMACGTPVIVMSDCEWAVADAFRELRDRYTMPAICSPSPTAIHRTIEMIFKARDYYSSAAREAMVNRYDWWSMYETMDQEFRNAAAFKMQMASA
jgi:hypothetical protein